MTYWILDTQANEGGCRTASCRPWRAPSFSRPKWVSPFFDSPWALFCLWFGTALCWVSWACKRGRRWGGKDRTTPGRRPRTWHSGKTRRIKLNRVLSNRIDVASRRGDRPPAKRRTAGFPGCSPCVVFASEEKVRLDL